MEFTYDAYKKLLNTLKSEDYIFEVFDNDNEEQKTVICRHDIDFSLTYAVHMAELENELDISSVYFVLLSTNFYNLFSLENRSALKYLKKLNHKIGLHFDASIYEYNSVDELENFIVKEQKILESLIEDKVDVVSFHRPVKGLFNMSLNDGLISAYDEKYFSHYEYISDSRRIWKKNPYHIIQDSVEHIQLLTHPIWYHHESISPQESIKCLKRSIDGLTNDSLVNNIRDYYDFMKGL